MMHSSYGAIIGQIDLKWDDLIYLLLVLVFPALKKFADWYQGKPSIEDVGSDGDVADLAPGKPAESPKPVPPARPAVQWPPVVAPSARPMRQAGPIPKHSRTSQPVVPTKRAAPPPPPGGVPVDIPMRRVRRIPIQEVQPETARRAVQQVSKLVAAKEPADSRGESWVKRAAATDETARVAAETSARAATDAKRRIMGLALNHSNLEAAVVWSEILGPPLALRSNRERDRFL